MIVGIEGYWGIGKTTTARRLAAEMRSIYIPEPDHLSISASVKDLDMWYKDAFIRRDGRFLAIDDYIVDRTPVSVIAFMEALGKPVSANFDVQVQEVQSKYDIIIYIEDSGEFLDRTKYDLTPLVRDRQFRYRYKQALLRRLARSNVQMIRATRDEDIASLLQSTISNGDNSLSKCI